MSRAKYKYRKYCHYHVAWFYKFEDGRAFSGVDRAMHAKNQIEAVAEIITSHPMGKHHTFNAKVIGKQEF